MKSICFHSNSRGEAAPLEGGTRGSPFQRKGFKLVRFWKVPIVR